MAGRAAKAQRKIMSVGSKVGRKVRKAVKGSGAVKKKASTKTKAPKASKRVNKGYK